jgi:hypothetical protein
MMSASHTVVGLTDLKLPGIPHCWCTSPPELNASYLNQEERIQNPGIRIQRIPFKSLECDIGMQIFMDPNLWRSV